MAKAVFEWLRGARRIGLYAALVGLALLALICLRNLPSTPHAEKTALETRLERILVQLEGVDEVSAMVTESDEGTVTGVVIVAEGLKDVRAYLQIQRAVQTLLDIDCSRISIIGNDCPLGGGP